MYIDLGSSSETASATITIALAASSSSAKWNILVRQIDCHTSYTAPEGCAMFFTGISGSWSNYGYVSGTTTTEHSPNQNFKVCIRREDGYCSIRHFTTTSTSFSLSSQADGTTAPTTGFRGATDCYLDFITIPRSVSITQLILFTLISSGSLDGSGPVTFDRYCGAKMGWTPASAANQPIICECYHHFYPTYVTTTCELKSLFPSQRGSLFRWRPLRQRRRTGHSLWSRSELPTAALLKIFLSELIKQNENGE